MLGQLEVRVVGVDQLGAQPRALLQLRVARQLGDPELGQPALARADELALPAQLEVDLGEPEAVGVLGQRPQPGRPRARRTAGTATACGPRPIRPRSWCSCEIP